MSVKIYIIESLSKQDRLTGNEIYQDLLRWESDRNHEVYTSYESIISKEFFYSHFKKISGEVNIGDIIILQLEMHGDTDKSGIVLRNGELITWNELLPIFNVVKSNCTTLHLLMATCFGNYVSKLLLNGNMPFNSFTGTEFEITEQQIIEDYSQIYTYFFQERDFYKAIRKIESLDLCSQVKTKDSKTLIDDILLYVLEKYKTAPIEQFSELITAMFGIDFGKNLENNSSDITRDRFIEVITNFFKENSE